MLPGSLWGVAAYLWGPVEAALDVGVHALVAAARGAEVDHLDARPLGVAKEDVLGLQVAVDDVNLQQGPAWSAGKSCMAVADRRVGGLVVWPRTSLSERK